MNNDLELAIRNNDIEALETQEWLESLDDVLKSGGPERVKSLLQQLQMHAQQAGVSLPYSATTPFLNTVPVEDQAPYPGSREIERRIKSLARWNAMAMVVRANRIDPDIGGHISVSYTHLTLPTKRIV